jgi:putative nucleotidyltransferase with HDIG domain
VTSPIVPEEGAGAGRWRGRPVLSTVVRVGIFVAPIALSIVSATITAHVLPRPRTDGWLVGWWAAVIGVPTIVLFATERLTRRAMPLAVLLKMTMVFPDQAPKRLAVARRAGSTRDLARRVEEARTHGTVDEPVLAAEKILALAAALNAHDRLTRGHGERVRAFTDLVADELNLPASDRDRLRWAALLHDIGKLAVHPHILNKPDKLNDEEWAVIKNHPLEGARLTAPLAGWLGTWANTIAEHHERYDGAGYPYGLTGNQISLGARIVAVADSYDVMTAIRTYKRPMSPEAARAELAACAGSQFDPRVVRAFLDVSIGRLRLVAGPLAWLGSLPFVSGIPQLGQAGWALARVGATSVVVVGAVAAGSLQAAGQATAVPRLNRATVSRGLHSSGSGDIPSGSPSAKGPAGRGTAGNGLGGSVSGNPAATGGSVNTGGDSGTSSTTVANSQGSGSKGSGSSESGSTTSVPSGSGSTGSGSSATTTTAPTATTTTTAPTTITTTTTAPTATTTTTTTTTIPKLCLLRILCL